MRNYYLHGADKLLTSSFTASLILAPACGGLYSFAKTLREGIYVSHGQLFVTKPSILKSEPGNLIAVSPRQSTAAS
jgi:hypothetical protein